MERFGAGVPFWLSLPTTHSKVDPVSRILLCDLEGMGHRVLKLYAQRKSCPVPYPQLKEIRDTSAMERMWVTNDAYLDQDVSST